MSQALCRWKETSNGGRDVLWKIYGKTFGIENFIAKRLESNHCIYRPGFHSNIFKRPCQFVSFWSSTCCSHKYIYIYLLYDMRPDMHMLIYIHICIYRYIHMYIDACSSTWPRNQTAPPNALALPTTRPRLQRPLPGNKKNPLRYFFLLEFLPVSTLVNFSSYTPED